jgi:hypothetical protein
MKRSINALAMCTAVLATLLLVPTVAQAQWTVTQLTDNSYADEYPQVSGSHVAWQGRPDDGDWEVFFTTAPPPSN